MSRQERRAEMRRTQKTSRKRSNPHEFDPGRRTIIKAGLGGLGLLATGGIIVAFHEGRQQTDDEVILGEVKRLGITKNSEEVALWSPAYQDSDQYLSPTAENDAIYSDRVLNTLDIMLKSNNPHFKQTSQDLHALVTNKLVRLVKMPDRPGEQATSAAVGYGPNNSGKFDYELNISPKFVLNDSSGLTLAEILTHEVEHIKRFEAYRASISTLPAQEQEVRLDKYFDTPEQNQVEEAAAYAKEAQSYIFQVGLLGYVYRVKNSGGDERAANYIRLGNDSTKWKNYIVKNGGTH